MNSTNNWDKVAISVRARKILQTILHENPVLEKILRNSENETEALEATRNWILPILKRNSAAEEFYKNDKNNLDLFRLLNWQDLAAIRILDYTDHADEKYPDQNIRSDFAITNPM